MASTDNDTYREGIMSFGYADPPYLGQCDRYGHRHEFPFGCWDRPQAHGELIAMLRGEFDGWALSLSSTSLQDILPFCPPKVRIGSWTKTFCAHKANVRIAYSWEPIIFVPGRDRSADGAPVGHDSLVEPITLQRGLLGAKSERFCRFVLDLMGYLDGDEMHDIFPGTGVMGRVLAQERMRLEVLNYEHEQLALNDALKTDPVRSHVPGGHAP